MTSTKPKFRILSLDGGGVRAVIESTLIHRLHESQPHLLDDVDLFAGTSAGGILALCFAAGLTNDETTKFYYEDVVKVFNKSLFRRMETLDSAIAPLYTNDELRNLLVKQFGTKKLGDLPRKVIIPSFQLDNSSCVGTCEDDWVDISSKSQETRRWVPRFFHNLPGSTSNDELVVDVALRTSAAPTYFPVYQGYVDGGVFANNPSLCAVTAAISAGVALTDIAVLSLSTGRDGLFIAEEQCGKGNWGLTQWAPHLADMLLDAGLEVTDFQCQALMGPRYHRIDPALPREIALDQPNEIPALNKLARQVDLVPTCEWLLKYWCSAPGEEHPHIKNPVTTKPGVEPTPLQSTPAPANGWFGNCSIQ